MDKEQINRIYDRAGGLCEGMVNGKPCGSAQRLQIHHDPIKGMGGTTHIYTDDELWLLCYRCHANKHGERVV